MRNAARGTGRPGDRALWCLPHGRARALRAIAVGTWLLLGHGAGAGIFRSHPSLRQGWGTRRVLLLRPVMFKKEFTVPIVFVGKLLILWDRLAS